MHTHLNKENRACIAALLRKKYSYSEIARILAVHPSTISREVRRNSIDIYRVHQAHRRSIQRRVYARSDYRMIDADVMLEADIVIHLKQHWSPQQIQNRLGVSSTSSIYRYLNRNTHLKQYLRRQGKRRRKYGTKRIPSRYQANKRSIHERPSISTIGHWEGDTVLGAERKLRIVTYVDKVSGYLVAHKATGSADVIHFLAKKHLNTFSATLSLTTMEVSSPCINLLSEIPAQRCILLTLAALINVVLMKTAMGFFVSIFQKVLPLLLLLILMFSERLED